MPSSIFTSLWSLVFVLGNMKTLRKFELNPLMKEGHIEVQHELVKTSRKRHQTFFTCGEINPKKKFARGGRMVMKSPLLCQWYGEVLKFFFKYIAFKKQPKIFSYRRCGKK